MLFLFIHGLCGLLTRGQVERDVVSDLECDFAGSVSVESDGGQRFFYSFYVVDLFDEGVDGGGYCSQVIGVAGSPSGGGFSNTLSAIERHFMPCSASKGVMFVSESGVVFQTCAIMGAYL